MRYRRFGSPSDPGFSLASPPRPATMRRMSAEPVPAPKRYRSIFAPGSRRERRENFESYLEFTRRRDGDVIEAEKDLTRKREILAGFQSNPVRSRKPLPDPERFYRNYVRMQDDPATLDEKTLLLTFLYKFARHEWVGISAAWPRVPLIEKAKNTKEKISKYHLCE